MINPIPYIKINGTTIPAGLNADGDFTSVVASGFTLQWGRSDYLDQPQAGSLSVTLYDKSGTWATSQDLIGLSVEAGMTYSGKTRIIFRGRIMDAELSYVQTNEQPIFALALNCSDKIGELGQTYIADTPFGRESYSDRRDRLMSLGANKIIAGIGGGLNPWLSEMDSGDSSILSHIERLFESVGDRMSYDPTTNRLEAMGRLEMSGKVLRLALNDTGMYGVELNLDEGSSPRSNLPAYGLTAQGGLRRSISSGITEVRIGYKTHGNDYIGEAEAVYVKSTGLNETTLGRRVLKVDSGIGVSRFANGNMINFGDVTYLADQYVEMAQSEARQWIHPPVTWDSRLNGGFRTEAELFALLRCFEVRAPVYFQNSIYNSINTQTPVYRIIGGTVEFVGGPEGGWISTVNLGPIKVNTTDAPVTWATINTSTTETVTWELLDNSVTAAALAHVTQGVD
ncbi:hypothetical protein [Arthrobacter sp. BF1]|uniref:hypothetical protein n=1 Tax=Arthrobacter sp. BF1 TaxID=2821145 RepID=UPI001C4FD21F|nr:hypothetical protein [Arthrobacter sp. BF1]